MWRTSRSGSFESQPSGHRWPGIAERLPPLRWFLQRDRPPKMRRRRLDSLRPRPPRNGPWWTRGAREDEAKKAAECWVKGQAAAHRDHHLVAGGPRKGQAIKLEDLGIPGVGFRHTIMGARSLKLSGPDRGESGRAAKGVSQRRGPALQANEMRTCTSRAWTIRPRLKTAAARRREGG